MNCQDCKWWKPTSADYGICQFITGKKNVAVIEIVIVTDTNEHKIDFYAETISDFSCNSWEPILEE